MSQDADQTPTLAVSELLTYVFQHLPCSPADNIKSVIMQFFNVEEIVNAKKMLWKHYSVQLNKFTKRTDKGTKSAIAKDTDDILKAAQTIEANFSDHEDLPVTFVARDLNRIPMVKPEEIETFSILERLNRLETEMAEVHKQIRPSYAKIAQTNPTRTIGNTGYDSNVRVPVSDQQIDPPKLMVNLPPLHSKPDITDEPDEQPWQDIRKRPNRNRPKRGKPPAIYGTRQGTSLRAGPRRHSLFVFRVHADIDETSITNFLTNENVTVANVERLSREDSWTNSFRITVESDDISGLLSPEFWPDGIGCRRYYSRKIPESQPPWQASAQQQMA